jgi:hypothetical protein
MSAAQQDVQQTTEPRGGVVGGVDLVPALGVLCAVAGAGLPLGALWSWLAPPEFVARSALAPTPGGVLPFVGQSEHRFDDMATFGAGCRGDRLAGGGLARDACRAVAGR